MDSAAFAREAVGRVRIHENGDDDHESSSMYPLETASFTDSSLLYEKPPFCWSRLLLFFETTSDEGVVSA
jgi:hypothetical protein